MAKSISRELITSLLILVAISLFLPAHAQTQAHPIGGMRPWNGRNHAKQPAHQAGIQGLYFADAISNSVVDQLEDYTDKHWHMGEYNHIVNLYRMVVSAHPDDFDAYANAGWLLWSMDRDTEAVAFYEQGLKANPNNYYMYDELGNYYYHRKKDWVRAIAYYEKAVTFKNCPFFSVHMLAHAYEKAGRLDQSLATWKRAVSLPEGATARHNLERVQKLIDQQKTPKK